MDNDLQLVFDQPVSNVWVSGTQAQPDNGNPPTAVWKVASRQLDIWKDVRDGFNPEREVPLFITYEDEMGSRQETTKVKLGAFEIYVSPTQIEGGTVLDGEEEVDPDLLNEGITIKFSKTIKKGTIEIKPFSGQPLGWLAEWGNQSVTITPPNGQRLLNGMTYVIEIKEIKDLGGNPVENIQITFTTKK